MTTSENADTGLFRMPLLPIFIRLSRRGLFNRASGDPELADQVLQLLRLFGKLGGRC